MNHVVDPFKCNPGPCPVDDSPAHTCVPEGYVSTDRSRIVVPPFTAATSVTVPVTSSPAAAAPPEPETTFTTSSYRRAEHGREARAKKAKGAR